ncbi:MAG: hypothetical protein WD740_02275 [Anaerolineales bacterium]
MDTYGYMILGFALVFTVIAIHLASFAIRSRNLSRDLDLLEKLNRRAPKKKQAHTKKKN